MKEGQGSGVNDEEIEVLGGADHLRAEVRQRRSGRGGHADEEEARTPKEWLAHGPNRTE